MEIEKIEKNFSPSAWVKRTNPKTVVEEHVAFVTAESRRVKSTYSCSLDVPYGSTPGQKLDLFGFDTLEKDSKICIYVHGGCWQELSREISAYCVAPLIKSGIAVVIMGYDLAPIVTLDEIVKQIENGVKFVTELAEERKSKGIYLCGHSAGAHLIAMLLTSQLVADKIDTIKGFFMISGIFDLHLVLLTSINIQLKLDDSMVSELSPKLKVNSIPQTVLDRIKLHFVVGEEESPEFISQSRNYVYALADKKCRFLCSSVFQSYDHFNIVEDLHNYDSRITESLLNFISDEKQEI